MWIISKLVVVKKGNKVDFRSKQSGHPVTPKGIWFSCETKPLPKEACDVRCHYSTLFPLSSNKNYRPIGYRRGNRASYPGAARQTFSTHLSWVRQARHRETLPLIPT
jgi:hypothetical protein